MADEIVALSMLSPPFILTTAAIALTNGGSQFYSRVPVGLGGTRDFWTDQAILIRTVPTAVGARGSY
jgi:lipopolysaccharide/colanic/teichoic acid biosynthesis glycosyltransferase